MASIGRPILRRRPQAGLARVIRSRSEISPDGPGRRATKKEAAVGCRPFGRRVGRLLRVYQGVSGRRQPAVVLSGKLRAGGDDGLRLRIPCAILSGHSLQLARISRLAAKRRSTVRISPRAWASSRSRGTALGITSTPPLRWCGASPGFRGRPLMGSPPYSVRSCSRHSTDCFALSPVAGCRSLRRC